MQVSEALESAADLIEEKGWVQGRGSNDEGAVCAMIAVNRVTNNDSWAWMPALQVLTNHVGVIPAWNDHPKTTQQEVLDTFRLVAKHQRILEEQTNASI